MIQITSIPQFNELVETSPKLLVEFYASWCPHCQAFEPLLAQAASELSVPVAQVEIDNNPELSGYFEIESIPTLVVIQDGEQVARHVGALEPAQVVEFVNNN